MDALLELTFSQLNFTHDCHHSAQLLAASQNNSGLISADGIILLVRALVPLSTQDNVTDGNILDWFITCEAAGSGITSFVVWNAITTSCRIEYCRSLPLQGNPDILGIGVIISYYIEIALATLFFIASSYFAEIRRQKAGCETLYETPLWIALKSSAFVFYTAAIFLALPVVFTSLLRSFFEVTLYDITFTAIGTFILVAAPFTTWNAFTLPSERRDKHPVFLDMLGHLAFCLGIRNTYLYSQNGTDMWSWVDSQFYQHCQSNGEKMWTLLLCLLCIVLPSWLVFKRLYDYLSFGMDHRDEYSDAGAGLQDVMRSLGIMYRQARDDTLQLCACARVCIRFPCWFRQIKKFPLATCFFVWLFAASLMALRQDYGVLAGHSLQQDTWGFSQISAVFPFLPTPVRFLMVWLRQRGIMQRQRNDPEMMERGANFELNRHSSPEEEAETVRGANE